MALIDFQDLSFTYPTGIQALSNINLSIASGEFIVIFGASGCGKTTLLRHIKPALTPHGQRTGELLFEGKPITALSAREQAALIGFVMQNPSASIVADKVWHEIAFGLENLGLPQEEIRLRAAEVAEFFGISELFEAPIANLSGGQIQLVNLAAIMAMRPRVIVLDEPTAQIDPIMATTFLNALRRLNNELGITTILCEHRLEDALPICDRAVMMSGGRIVADESPHRLAQALDSSNDPGFLSMPAPVRVYSGIKALLQSEAPCPTTVRECANILTANFNPLPIASKETRKAVPKRERPLISASHIWFRYERESPDVIRELDLNLFKGDMYCLMGGNGAGKSTILSILSGELTPYRGAVFYDGVKLTKKNASKLRLKTFRLPQEPLAMFLHDNCARELSDLGGAEDIERVSAAMDLNFSLKTHPYDLSGGEAQRLAIAKALMLKPDVMLLDEPTKGMDGAFKLRFGKLLKDLCKEGVSIILASHDADFCAEFADMCGLCFGGGIISQAPPHEFFSRMSFYTTAANRISKTLFPCAITVGEVIASCKKTKSPYTE